MGCPSWEAIAEMDRIELASLKMKHTYDFPMASMTADVVVYNVPEDKFLMIERRDDGKWAHAGGYVDIADGERVHECALRELKEETGLVAKQEELMLIGLFDEPLRDHRGRTISACYVYLQEDDQQAVAGDDAKSVKLLSLDEITLMEMDGNIAFDHAYMIQQTLQFLQAITKFHNMEKETRS